ncbi:MAG TPA: glycoside hydrolase family 15 protein [Acidimicrobiales bacterium]|nr:glycoside hydrolase family 15 protein [Acidimicrobiales bacterium]
MALRIEDYGIIGDTHTAALVGRNGSIDWLCLPRFDSEACFSALLGDDRNGHWRIAPDHPAGAEGEVQVRRRYRGDSLVLDTEFETPDGAVRLTDCMPLREQYPHVVRMVEGLRGTVPMRMDLAMRFAYGSLVPWVRQLDGLLCGVAGPDALALWTPVETRGEDLTTVATFDVPAGERVPFVLSWYPSHDAPPRPVDAGYAIGDTAMWWEDWASMCTYDGVYRDAVVRSLITLKALTYHPTGGIVAAATTSLPETLGGERNWDYRYCWLRDATLTLESLMRGGFHDEALDWRDWLLRAVAGDVSKLQIMYGPAGERRLEEWEVDWLGGYETSKPVRIGNAASGQFQLDVYGEVLSALYEACTVGSAVSASAWDLQVALVRYVATHWQEPDDGIWEVRGPRRHFTHSKVMAWVAVDRGVRTIEEYGLDGPLDEWRALRDQIHEDVCAKGYNDKVGAFTQYYGCDTLDASVLMMPLVGFLPPTDERVRSTVEAIERDLTEDGFVLRYRTEDSGQVDGLAGHEGAFLACSFWLADCLELIGRHDDATALFERLIGLRNDLGLLAEEYDVRASRQVGNFPQAFSHVSLVNAAFNLTGHTTMAEQDVRAVQAARRSRHARHQRMHHGLEHPRRALPRRVLPTRKAAAPATESPATESPAPQSPAQPAPAQPAPAEKGT